MLSSASPDADHPSARRPLSKRLSGRLPRALRSRVPVEISALWQEPRQTRVLAASVISMFTLAVFPPFLTPGAEMVQTVLKDDPASLGMVVLLGIALGAGAVLIGGAIGDTSGHRRWLLAGLVGLLASSLFGITTGEAGLVVTGLLGGFWSGFAMPLGIAIVADAYPDRVTQETGIGIGLAAMAAAQILAPLIQDAAHDLIGLWAIYALPIASTALALFLVARDVPGGIADIELGRRYVLTQSLLAAVPLAIAAFIIVLLPGEGSAIALAALATIGLVGAVATLLRVRRGRGILPAPAAPARMIVVALFVGVFMSFALTAPLHYFGSFLRIVRDWQELPAIVALVPYLVPLLLGGVWAPRLADRFGYPRLILGSMVVLAFSTAMFAAASSDTGYPWFVLPLFTLGLGMIVGATARAGLIMSRMPRSLPGLANALNLASMELGSLLGSTVMTVMLMRFATEDYAERLTASPTDSSSATEAVAGFREVLRSVTPGGTTVIAPEQVEGLLPGFGTSLADGLSQSLWWVTVAILGATAVAAALFRWARGKDERPAVPIEEERGPTRASA